MRETNLSPSGDVSIEKLDEELYILHVDDSYKGFTRTDLALLGAKLMALSMYDLNDAQTDELLDSIEEEGSEFVMKLVRETA